MSDVIDEQKTPMMIKKSLPPNKKFTPIANTIISSAVANDTDEAAIIAEDETLTNEEKVELLQDLLASKQAKIKTLSQPAAQRRYLDVMNTARQYISLLKDGVSLDDDDEEHMDVFDMIYYNAKQVGLKISNALIITGDSGMGKTHEALAALQFLNPTPIREEQILSAVLEDEKTPDNPDEIDIAGDNFTILRKKDAPGKKPKNDIRSSASSLNSAESGYYIASGICTTAALYDLMWIHRNKIIVFNDLDSILEDKESVNLLKAALDTYPVREISKLTKGNSFNSLGMTDSEMWYEYEVVHNCQKVPNQFKFTGGIIFISNIHEDKFDKALISRSLHVEVRLSKQQVITRMHKLMVDIRAHVEFDKKVEALEHLEHLTTNYICKFDLNLRELIHAIDYRTAQGDKVIKLGQKEVPLWKELLRGRIVKSKNHRL